MNKTNLIVILIAVILSVIYLSLFPPASRGYGYLGYYGYHRGPSFFYFGGAHPYYDRSINNGSISGIGVRGRGPGVGK